jgi:hypothetical protein
MKGVTAPLALEPFLRIVFQLFTKERGEPRVGLQDLFPGGPAMIRQEIAAAHGEGLVDG